MENGVNFFELSSSQNGDQLQLHPLVLIRHLCSLNAAKYIHRYIHTYIHTEVSKILAQKSKIFKNRTGETLNPKLHKCALEKLPWGFYSEFI